MSDFVFNCSLRDSSTWRAHSICRGMWAGSAALLSNPAAAEESESRGNVSAPRRPKWSKKTDLHRNVRGGGCKVQPGPAKFKETSGPAAREHSCIPNTQPPQNNPPSPWEDLDSGVHEQRTNWIQPGAREAEPGREEGGRAATDVLLLVQRETRSLPFFAASPRATIPASLFTRWPFLIQECKACQPLTHIKLERVKEWEERWGGGTPRKHSRCESGGGRKHENEE